MPDYQGNSNVIKEGPKSEPQKKNLEKVVTGDVIMRKPGIAARFKGVFFGGDMHTAREYVITSVLLPALRNLVWEAISSGSDRLIYGEHGRPRRPTGITGPRVQYNNPVYRQDPRSQAYLPDRPPSSRWTQSAKPFDDVIVGTREEAEAVVERLIDVVDQYQVVSVADLLELIGQPSSHVDNKWGWTNMRSIEHRQVPEGWKITLPPVEEI